MNEERRDYRALGRTPLPCGRTMITIRCPWCNETFDAYVWSLAGSGKRCPNCRSLHTSASAWRPPGLDPIERSPHEHHA